MKPRQIEIRTDGGRYIEGQTGDKKVEKAA
jgi:hypothetical protein